VRVIRRRAPPTKPTPAGGQVRFKVGLDHVGEFDDGGVEQVIEK
jgi:hypothetical protein